MYLALTDEEPKSVDELLATSGTLSAQPLLPEKPACAQQEDEDDSDCDSIPG